jgi:bifunctional non-homologous end joining protein LigD
VSPFCVRPLPGAPVSMPIEWSQVNGRLKLERFNIRSARQWLVKHGDPLKPVLTEASDMLAALESLARRVAGRGP